MNFNGLEYKILSHVITQLANKWCYSRYSLFLQLPAVSKVIFNGYMQSVSFKFTWWPSSVQFSQFSVHLAILFLNVSVFLPIFVVERYLLQWLPHFKVWFKCRNVFRTTLHNMFTSPYIDYQLLRYSPLAFDFAKH